MTSRDELRASIEMTRIEMINELRDAMIACVNESCDAMRDDDDYEIDDIHEYIERAQRMNDNAHDIVHVIEHYESITCSFDDENVDVEQREMLNVMRVLNARKRDDNRDDIDTICNAICDVFDM